MTISNQQHKVTHDVGYKQTDHHQKNVKQLQRGWYDHISMSSRSGRGKRSIAAIPVNCAN